MKATNGNSIWAVIPAYNVAKTIGEVVSKIRDLNLGIRVAVIDDGSIDDTGRKAADAGAHAILRHDVNRGKGAALRTGFSWVVEEDARTIVTIDGDGQHDPIEIPKLYDKLTSENYDIVLGSRFHDIRSMPPHRKMSNIITSRLISWRINQEVPDSQCGFRALKRRVLEGLNLSTNHYDLESELLIKAALHEFIVGSVSINTIYNGSDSSVGIADVLRFVSLFCRSWAWKRRHQHKENIAQGLVT